MTPSTHYEYRSHLSTQLINNADKAIFWEQVGTYAREVSMLSELSLDSVRESLADLYCPTSNGDPKDPCAMLRSWLLMTLCREGSPTVWATRLRREPALAIMAGFVPGQIPCATTHINFLKRLLDGPYAVRKKQDVTRSRSLAGRHRRRLEDATKERAAAAEAAGKTQSELLAHTLLEQTEQPRNPHELQTRLEHLFVELGLRLTLEADIITKDTLSAAGDGTAEPSAASKQGRRACHCTPGSKCGCPRDYTSKTAQFCYDKQHGWIFGDRSYTISVNVNGRDIPLMTIMGTGNESDFTLSLKALDRLLKMLEELELPLSISIFIGDGHHDAMGIYRYLQTKGIVPVIPLNEDSKPTQSRGKPSPLPETSAKTTTIEPSSSKEKKNSVHKTPPKHTPRPQIAMYPELSFEPDGTPLCPGGCRMRYQTYFTTKAALFFACPCKRKNRAGVWIFHANECPFQTPCTPPDKKMGYTLYIKSEADLRLFPPIPRDSKRFKHLYALRSGTERQNAVADSYHLDRRHRNAAYTLVRMTFVNICKHARMREEQRHKNMAQQARLHGTLAQLNVSELLPN